MSRTRVRFLHPRSRSQSGQRSKSCLGNNSKTTEANLTKLHRKIEHNEFVYKCSFAQIPISRENMNVFCSLITMVPKWNYFIFMQIDYPRWPPGTVTENSINTKMTISQDPLVEIDLFHIVISLSLAARYLARCRITSQTWGKR